MTTTEKRYIVDAPAHPGKHFQRYGWTVRDTHPENPSCRVVASGGKDEMAAYARSLNSR